jgi:hypothetical protein
MTPHPFRPFPLVLGLAVVILGVLAALGELWDTSPLLLGGLLVAVLGLALIPSRRQQSVESLSVTHPAHE